MFLGGFLESVVFLGVFIESVREQRDRAAVPRHRSDHGSRSEASGSGEGVETSSELQSTHAGKPWVAYPTMKRLLIHTFAL